MINKTAAFFFILIANMLLLAHAVVPHHHHGKQVCLVRSHCECGRDSDIQDAGGELPHHHDDENNPDNCILKELIAVPSNEWNQEIKFTTGCNYLNDYYAFLYGLPVTEEKAFIPVARRSINALNIDSSYTLYASTSLGLRAPPVV